MATINGIRKALEKRGIKASLQGSDEIWFYANSFDVKASVEGEDQTIRFQIWDSEGRSIGYDCLGWGDLYYSIGRF